MKRECQIIATSKDGRKAICIDIENKVEILKYIQKSKRHKKKWNHIVEILLNGHKNSDLYDKEEVNEKCKGVTAMKFFKGQENDRIYCKEQRTEQGLYIIITIQLHNRKKTQSLSKKEISIIEKIGKYEYEIKE